MGADPRELPAVSAALIERLEEFVEERLGILCVDWQRTRLRELIAHRGTRSAEELLRSEASHLSSDDMLALIEKVSVGETYFFREPGHLRALAETVLPERNKLSEESRPLRLVSVGCSTGEEAYSMAITLREHCDPLLLSRVLLYGVDINASALGKARRARYSAWALRATPPELRDLYFHKEGEEYALREDLRSMVHFQEHNLLALDDGFFMPGSCDVIFCRNVLIYFSERSLRAAVARLADALAPGGFLFLGHSENLRGISDAFVQCHSHDTFYYRKKPGGGSFGARYGASSGSSSASSSAASSRSSVSSEASTSGASLVPVNARSLSWFDAIGDSARRVAELTSEKTPSVSAAPLVQNTPAPAGPVVNLLPVLEHIAAERFDAALALIEQIPRERRNTAVMLATATIYCGQGRLTESQRACQRLLDGKSHVAEAHYLLGLCHEHAGDSERAQRCYQQAVRADARFAMAPLRLGAVLRRRSQRDLARVALRQALELLANETAERVLLFGGGFQRDALIRLCRAELYALGASK